MSSAGERERRRDFGEDRLKVRFQVLRVCFFQMLQLSSNPS